MCGTQKLKARTWFAIISSAIILTSCANDPASLNSAGGEIVGNTQGTTYTIIIANEEVNFTKIEIDSILHDFDFALSTYLDNSAITQLNDAKVTANVQDQFGYFKSCYEQSLKVFTMTGGAFDPSVYPLVEGWGFMNNVNEPMLPKEVDSVMEYIGFDKHHTIYFTQGNIQINKEFSQYKLDFNAIAQGYSVDVLDQFLASRGHKNYYVEIGGELIVRGKNREGNKWRIGIDTPKEHNNDHELNNIMYVSDVSIATSGNYRKFYEKDGVKYAHTLNPKTGYPVTHSLLSVTVIAETCAQADAYATAFMVIGANETLRFVENHPELSLKVYLLESGFGDKISHSSNDAFLPYLKE